VSCGPTAGRHAAPLALPGPPGSVSPSPLSAHLPTTCELCHSDPGLSTSVLNIRVARPLVHRVFTCGCRLGRTVQCVTWCPALPLLQTLGVWPTRWARHHASVDEAAPPTPTNFEWRHDKVADRSAVYGVAGSGPPVVFVHGWGMGAHVYKRPLRRLAARGRRVYAPALPGFGGTENLPPEQRTIAGYAAWLDAFLDAMGISEPTLVIGHSFGGGVATVLAHDFPSRVSYLVLLNSVGGTIRPSDPPTARVLADRPLWEWGVHFGRELLPPTRGIRIINAMREDLVPNLLSNPRAIWDVGMMARGIDLSAEMTALRGRSLPVLALSGDRDGVIPQASFNALCDAIGAEGLLMSGNHGWLLADPAAFEEVMANVLELAGAAATAEAREGMDHDPNQGGD
jgi:pimeloyl-ACP methyl ester carboxylesterase